MLCRHRLLQIHDTKISSGVQKPWGRASWDISALLNSRVSVLPERNSLAKGFSIVAVSLQSCWGLGGTICSRTSDVGSLQYKQQIALQIGMLHREMDIQKPMAITKMLLW